MAAVSNKKGEGVNLLGSAASRRAQGTSLVFEPHLRPTGISILQRAIGLECQVDGTAQFMRNEMADKGLDHGRTGPEPRSADRQAPAT
jgi:hypothetical protein